MLFRSAKTFLEIARRLEAEVARQNAGTSAEEPTQAKIGPAGELKLTWPDGHEGSYAA